MVRRGVKPNAGYCTSSPASIAGRFSVQGPPDKKKGFLRAAGLAVRECPEPCVSCPGGGGGGGSYVTTSRISRASSAAIARDGMNGAGAFLGDVAGGGVVLKRTPLFFFPNFAQTSQTQSTSRACAMMSLTVSGPSALTARGPEGGGGGGGVRARANRLVAERVCPERNLTSRAGIVAQRLPHRQRVAALADARGVAAGGPQRVVADDRLPGAIADRLRVLPVVTEEKDLVARKPVLVAVLAVGGIAWRADGAVLCGEWCEGVAGLSLGW